MGKRDDAVLIICVLFGIAAPLLVLLTLASMQGGTYMGGAWTTVAQEVAGATVIVVTLIIIFVAIASRR